VVSIVDKTGLYGVFWQHGALYKIRISFGTGCAFQFNYLILNFERANGFVEKGCRTEFSLDILNNHVDPRRVALVVCVNIQLEQIVFLFFVIEKIQNGENAGAKNSGKRSSNKLNSSWNNLRFNHSLKHLEMACK
jgi:hypothetical protein